MAGTALLPCFDVPGRNTNISYTITMRWIKYTFIGLTSLFIAVVAMLVTLVLLLEPNQLRDGLVAVVNRTTDNQLEINGPLQLDLSLSPSVKVSDIHFKNATEDFEFGAADISLQIDLLSMRTTYVIVHEILVKDGFINIRQTPDEVREDDDQARNVKIPFVERLQIENLVIHYWQPDETEPLEIRLASLQKDAPAGAETVVLTGTGMIDGIAFKLEGESGTAANLLTTDEPFPFNYHFDVMQATIHAEGRIIDPREAAELDITLQMEAPDVQGLLKLLHANAPDIGSLAATGRLTGSLGAPRLDDLELKASRDKVALQLSGTVGNLLSAEDIQFDFSTAIADAELLASLLPQQSSRFNSIKSAGKISGSGRDLLISDYSVDASGPGGLTLVLAGSFRVMGTTQPLRDVQATLSMTSPDTAFVHQFNETIPLMGPVAGTARLSMVSDVLLIDAIKLTAGDKQKLQIDARGVIKLRMAAAENRLDGLTLDIDLQALLPMTASGIAGLAIAVEGLAGGDAARAIGEDEAVQRGLAHLGRSLLLTDTHSVLPYSLYAVERACRLTNTRAFSGGGRTYDWYREGAWRFLQTQNPDGSWGEARPGNWEAHGFGKAPDTAFALLFLTRATATVGAGFGERVAPARVLPEEVQTPPLHRAPPVSGAATIPWVKAPEPALAPVTIRVAGRVYAMRAGAVTVRGTVEGPWSRLEVDGSAVEPDAAGRFAAKVAVEVSRSIDVVAVGRDGQQARSTVRVEIDGRAPTLTLAGAALRHVGQQRLVLEADEDLDGAKVGRYYFPASGRRVHVTAEIAEHTPRLVVLAQDLAGNETRQTFEASRCRTACSCWTAGVRCASTCVDADRLHARGLGPHGRSPGPGRRPGGLRERGGHDLPVQPGPSPALGLHVRRRHVDRRGCRAPPGSGRAGHTSRSRTTVPVRGSG